MRCFALSGKKKKKKIENPMFTQSLMVKRIYANPSLSSRSVPGFGKIRLQDFTLTVHYSEFNFTFHCCEQHNKKQQQQCPCYPG